MAESDILYCVNMIYTAKGSYTFDRGIVKTYKKVKFTI